ncbi:hypothetical protein GN109_16850 [Collimonas pratensis]|uniref:hypothetical protein n=1 Tax=Collimonas pratensis TaxID=279113 RepID=UPI00143D25A9|nr:hypothetical protein [Collimonas pratensis]NKI71096.1 hypothetical protein [Collimonas pratensis]
MDEKKIALGLGLAGAAFVALLVWLTMPASSSQAPIALLPASGTGAAVEAAAPPAKPAAIPAAIRADRDCSMQRLDSWRLISVEMGGYRQAGIAVFNNARRGSLTVSEAQSFDGDLLLEKVSSNAVTLRCGQLRQTQVLGESRISVEVPANPEMRTALPAPAGAN